MPESPRLLRSDWQPEVMFWTTAARLSFEHAGFEQRPVSQVLIVGTTEALLPLERTRPTRLCAFKQDASEEPTIPARVDWHCDEILLGRKRGRRRAEQHRRACECAECRFRQ